MSTGQQAWILLEKSLTEAMFFNVWVEPE